MRKKNYALLVGIDHYLDDNVPKLDAPRYDVQNMQAYLSSLKELPFKCKTLLVNGDLPPTRANIIAQFKSHLIKNAAKDVILLFYFSGHGSTEIADELFVRHQGNRVNETLICYDSRINGTWDLADKELKWLIHQAAEKQAEVVVIIDSCHSGSVTRGQIWKSRNYPKPASNEPRPLNTYLKGSTTYYDIPRHVLLGACKKDQQAIEIKTVVDGDFVFSGLFTNHLLSFLRNNPIPISYRDLMAKCNYLVQRTNPSQIPHLDAFDFFDTYRYFLNLDEQISNRYKYTLTLEKDGRWSINFGISNGMPYGTQQMATFKLFADEDLSLPIGHAMVNSVELNKSYLDVTFELQEKCTECWAISTFLPMQKLTVYTNVEQVKLEERLKALFPNEFDQQCLANLVDWNYVNQNTAEFYLEVADNWDYTLRYVDTNEVIFPKYIPEDPSNAAHFRLLKDAFSLIESWKRYAQISQPIQYSKFNKKGTFSFKLGGVNESGAEKLCFFHSKKNETQEVTLDFPGECGWVYKQKLDILDYSITFTNNVQKLYLYLLNFDLDYQILSISNGDSEALNKPQVLKNPLDNLKQGKILLLPNAKNQTTEILKLLVSERPFDHFLMDQKGLSKLEDPTMRSRGEDKGTMRGNVKKKPLSDWFTQTFQIKILRELGSIGPEPLIIPDTSIVVQAHPSFKAKASLISTARSARSHQLDYYLSTIAQQLGLELLDFSNQGRLGTLLELHHIEDKAAISAEHPLVINFEASILEGEKLMAVTLPPDPFGPEAAELYIPLGTITEIAEGKFELSIDQIPENPDDGRFEPERSLKIAIFRMPHDQ